MFLFNTIMYANMAQVHSLGLCMYVCEYRVCICLSVREVMLRNGLLVLSAANVHCSGSVLSSVIKSCVKTVCNLLYVHLVNCNIPVITDNSSQNSKPVNFGSVLCTQTVKHFVKNFYATAATVDQSLEVRFLLSNICSNLPQFPVPGQQWLHHGYEVVLTDLGQELHQAIANYVVSQFPVSHTVEVIQLPGGANNCQPNSSSNRLVVTDCYFSFAQVNLKYRLRSGGTCRAFNSR